jgi:hypothetical protein
MSNKMQFAMATLLIMFCNSAYASDVYIEQAGSNATIDITQTGTSNTVGSSVQASTISGDSVDVDVVQTGDSNVLDIATSMATDTVIDLETTGSNNETVIEISGTGNSVTADVTGDSNLISVCGTNDTAGGITLEQGGGGLAGCVTDVSVNDTTNDVVVIGDTNTLNFELDSFNAFNTIKMGENVNSSFNTVNLTQTGADTMTVDMTIDGDSNSINILQE